MHAIFQDKPAVKSAFNLSANETVVLLATFLFVLTLWVFSPFLDIGYINFDDPDTILLNPHVQHGLTWAGVKWAFLDYQQTANWHPLTWLSHMVDCQLFGVNPWGHHLTNILLHASNTVLIFLILTKLTSLVWRSFFVAALFGLHPLRVESVAWVSERKDVLSVLFLLFAIQMYARYAMVTGATRNKSKVFYWLALFFFCLGFMSKPGVVTLPLLLLLLDYWPLNRFQQKSFLNLLVEKIPFFLLAAAGSVATVVFHKLSGDVVAISPLPLQLRLENVVISYERYLGKIFWPADLAIFYPYPSQWPMATLIGAALILSGVFLFAFHLRHKQPFLWMGWLWFILALLPMIGLIQVGSQAMADRHSYVASIGIFIAVAWGISGLIQKQIFRLVAACAAAIAISTAGTLTRGQIVYWQNGETLFQHAIAVTKNNYMAHLHLAIYYADRGREKDAVEICRWLIQERPRYASAHLVFGNLLLKQGNFDEAAKQFQETIRLNPNLAEAHNNLGVALGKSGHSDAAINQLEEAVRLNPDYGKAHGNLGILLASQGKTNEAIIQLREAIKLEPDYLQAKVQLLKLNSNP